MEYDEKMLKGTTTVGIVFEGGVVVASDKRATMGTFIANKDVQKVHMVADKIALTMAGGVGDAQQLTHILRAELELYKYSRGRELTVKGASTLVANILQGNKYFPYMVQLIIAGYDSKPHVFDLDPFGGLLEDKYVSTGSGSVVAYGVLDENYSDKMSADDAVKLATRAIRAAIKRDNATGEGIDVVVITKDGAKKYSQAEVANAGA
ncbi:MAG: archaeal proteasome endopeptidase complex subunit beta [Candidatus Micrarchaeia archaeon]|jgi:proteasome beta subunit